MQDTNIFSTPIKQQEFPALAQFVNTDYVDKILSEGINNYYLSYPIAKSNGGRRWLDVPQGELKEAQYQIFYNILKGFKTHKCAVGFKEGVGIVDGSKQHLNSKVIFTTDIKNFFPAINKHRVLRILFWVVKQLQEKRGSLTWTLAEIKVLAKLLTYKNALPQGSPTSPILSNLVCYRLDYSLSAWAEANDSIYTRYADDITVSTKSDKVNILTARDAVVNHIRIANFQVNHDKTRIYRQNQCMLVTGVVVNKKLSVPKWKWRNFRAKLHNLEKSQSPITLKEYQKLKGYAEWIRQLHPQRGNSFLTKLGKLNLQKS